MRVIIHVDNETDPLAIRLVGNSILQGRLEILYYGSWGTICNIGFGFESGNVACRTLGFPGAVRVLTYAASGSGQVWLNLVKCVGNEPSLEECSHSGFGNNDCSHYSDVGVECLCKFLK